jgi:predicted kinase
LGVHPLSSDLVRLLLADDPTDQSLHYRVFTTIRYLLRNRLALRRPVTYIDATNLSAGERKPYFKLAEVYGCEVEALYFDVPLEICRERNRGRARVVPDDALERMAAKLAPPRLEEGFSRITVIGPAG